MIEPSKTSPKPLDRLTGLLIGGAVGDALGAPVEFMRRTEILSRFGPEGITRYAPAYDRLGAITDDTQMTLFTLEGLIRADIRWRSRGICNPVSVIDRAYRRWYATQTNPKGKSEDLDGWLIDLPQLWSRRAPGNTCLGAFESNRGIAEPATNNSKGAGGIMRVGPIGLIGARDAFGLATSAAALTHGHVTGSVAAGWFAAWIEGIGHGLDPRVAAVAALRLCGDRAPELNIALDQALARSGNPANVVPAALGEGWIAEEAAAVALWCVLTATNPFEALRLAVNIDGDSDTTGSLVGQVMGAIHGTSWIPTPLIDQLELKSEIERLAADAATVFSDAFEAEGEEFDAFWQRYPGW
jgi:ADP-ribosyl-[dinitrogen reductase] hydrolase